MQRYVVLDSWRGICACMVALLHFPAVGLLTGSDLVRSGYLFVDFFFVLSGFVIHGNYKDRLHDRYATAGFMLTRFGRLYPLHLFTLFAVLALELILFLPVIGSMSGEEPFSSATRSGPSFVKNLFLVDTLVFDPAPGWNAPSWSISAEFWAYLLFAVITFIFRKWAIFIAAGFCAVLPFAVGALSPDNMDTTTNFGMLRCIYGFSAGMIALEVHENYTSKIKTNQFVWSVVEILVVVGVAWFIVAAGISEISLVAPFVFVLALLVFAREGGLVSKILLLPFPVLLGTLSYSIYMTHWTIHGVARVGVSVLEKVTGYPLVSQRENLLKGHEETAYGGGWLTGDLLAFGVLGVVIIVSYFTYRFVEEPWRKKFREWGRMIERSRPAGTAPADAGGS